MHSKLPPPAHWPKCWTAQKTFFAFANYFAKHSGHMAWLKYLTMNRPILFAIGQTTVHRRCSALAALLQKMISLTCASTP